MINSLVNSEHKRVFVLRIEDTDQKRLVAGSIDTIISGLQYFGLEFDEGPLTPVAD